MLCSLLRRASTFRAFPSLQSHAAQPRLTSHCLLFSRTLLRASHTQPSIFDSNRTPRKLSTAPNQAPPTSTAPAASTTSKHHTGHLRSFPSPADYLSLSRLALTPLISHQVLLHPTNTLPLFPLFLLIAATDAFDGYVARSYGSSKYGIYLDPICDKLFIMAVVGSLWYTSALPSWLVGLVVGRDVGLIGGSVVGGAKKEVVDVLWVSKLNTVAGVVAIGGTLLLMSVEDGEEELEDVIDGGKGVKVEGEEEKKVGDKRMVGLAKDALWYSWGATTVLSGGAYFARFLRMRKQAARGIAVIGGEIKLKGVRKVG